MAPAGALLAAPSSSERCASAAAACIAAEPSSAPVCSSCVEAEEEEEEEGAGSVVSEVVGRPELWASRREPVKEVKRDAVFCAIVMGGNWRVVSEGKGRVGGEGRVEGEGVGVGGKGGEGAMVQNRIARPGKRVATRAQLGARAVRGICTHLVRGRYLRDELALERVWSEERRNLGLVVLFGVALEYRRHL